MSQNQRKNKLLLLGWDAADWWVIRPLLEQGKMPSLQYIIDHGVQGNLGTLNPPFSPMLWSSIATGKTPDKHGILGFVEANPNRDGIRPVSNKSRKAKALWNIFHHEGLRSNIIGWWPSYPIEPINGVMVSNTFQKVDFTPKEKNPIGKFVVHPDEYVKEIFDLRMFPAEITEAHILPFFPNAKEIDQEKGKSLETFAKILSENVSIHSAATYTMRTTDWDFMAVYYDMIDHFCHAFMKFHPPKLKAIPQESFELFKDVVSGAYQFQDMMLGRMLDLIDEDTTIMIISDHGFNSGSNRSIVPVKGLHAAPSLDHREFGVFAAMGPNIQKNKDIFGMNLLDIAPTILHHFNLPIGKDMDGKPMMDIFTDPSPIQYIPSWEEVPGDFGELEDNLYFDTLQDEETLQQLIDLGYIEKPDEDITKAVQKTINVNQHNLARVYIGKKEYENAEKILLELLPKIEDNLQELEKGEKVKNSSEKEQAQRNEELKVPVLVDLIDVSIHLQKLDQAEQYITELKNTPTQIHFNIFLQEAKIANLQGKVKKAIRLLEEAENKSSNPELYYQLGMLYRRISDFKKAEYYFSKALSQNKDIAKFHAALAEVYLRTQRYEAAANAALDSIELIRFYPNAHYLLGQALEKLGDVKNAKIAYETAAKLRPKEHLRSDHALDNIKEKLKRLETHEKNSFKKWDNQIVVVSGLPRSGTSLMMQMLDLGGIKPLTDNIRQADDSNPKGYYEYEAVKSLHKDNSWLHQAQNKAVKIVAPLLKHLHPQHRYKVIFMQRDLHEILKSQQIMLEKKSDTFPLKLYNKFVELLNHIEIWKEKEPYVEFIYIDYAELVENPKPALEKIQAFIGDENVDIEKMQAAIDPTLYRNKVLDKPLP